MSLDRPSDSPGPREVSEDLAPDSVVPPVKLALVDYGGVLAGSGFKQGIFAIAHRHQQDADAMYKHALDSMYESGYMVGRASEATFWATACAPFGIEERTSDLREEVLRRSVLRPGMLEWARGVRAKGILTVLLSDHTDWLDRLEQRDHFFCEFDHVYNSFHLGKSKRDASIFNDVLDDLGVSAPDALFVDNDRGNIRRARSRRLQAILYENEEQFRIDAARLLVTQCV